MENKKLKTLSIVALIVSVLPLATLVPVFLKITLSEGVSTVWAGVNVASAVAGLILSGICVRSDESRSPVNIASTVFSAFWCLLMMGMVVLALFLTFMQ
ncbi:hypothetical protein [Parablautia muri]|uniref:Uncharacterized protein n=1 Tax=Parablautia muri TaxID=2320879 RepID=A0A9X5GU02_9FIRM|nr:hypothetical protein [Parablautia muri]NBJ94541.1 hypothetical protein [Parablautia muri]